MSGRCLCVITLAVLVWSTMAGADAGLAFLRFGAGARAAALADATTALTGPQAGAANPAALLCAGRAAALSHTEWIGDIRHEHAASVWTRNDDVLALDLRLAHAGDLQRRVGPSAEPLGEFGVYEWTAGLAVARPLLPDLRLGVGLKYARQSIDVEAASGFAADLGLLYGSGPWWIGGAVRNLGAMNELDRQSTKLPLQVRLGGAAGRGPLLASADVRWTRDADPGVHLGTEWRARQRLVLRAGYQTADTRGVSLGLGVDTGVWGLDYAFVPFADGLGEAHHLSLVWGGR